MGEYQTEPEMFRIDIKEFSRFIKNESKSFIVFKEAKRNTGISLGDR